MSESTDLAGEGIPDIEGFLEQDRVVDKTPVVINTNIPGGVKETLPESNKLIVLNPHNPVKSLVNGVTQVSEMGKLVDMIATKDAISFSDAENVNLVFESFAKNFRMSEFTLGPSKTNLKEVKKFVDQELRLRKESVVAEYNGFVLEPFAELSNSFQQLKDNIRPTVVDAIEPFVAEVRVWLSDKQNIANQEVLQGNDTINLATTPIHNFPTEFSTTRGNQQLFVAAVKNIQSAVSSDDLKYLLEKMPNISKDGPQSVSLLNLIEMFGSEELGKVLSDSVERAEKALEELGELVASAKGDQTEFAVVQDFVVTNQDKTHDAVEAVRSSMNVHHFVRFLFVNLLAVMSFFKT